MLRLIAAALLCAGASAASASSIEAFKETSSTRSSIVEIGCHECARAAEAAAEEAEVRLEPGEQIFEVREVDGEQKIYRTEGWLGGSPITMVSKASEADLIALGIVEPESAEPATAVADAPAAVDGAADDSPVETAETAVETPAVTEPALIAPELIGKPLFEPVIANTDPGVDAASTTSALTAKDKPFDPSSFELRLN
ncbi:MAG: plant virulence effector HPE1-like domain-containing protein [Hoeflea sp.]|uniref:plant virulence effector HPE1-like domain-containing protein n=1 Tax=Hoeflea sp. TaxID=1940281 RepID=UPI0032EB85FB